MSFGYTLGLSGLLVEPVKYKGRKPRDPQLDYDAGYRIGLNKGASSLCNYREPERQDIWYAGWLAGKREREGRKA